MSRAMLHSSGAGPRAAVIGAGPAGLMAAQQLARAGCPVDVFDAMPSFGRKFLRAGIGGLNLSHAESFDAFCARYSHPDVVARWLAQFTPEDLRNWAAELGIETFVGSSGRIFPVQKKASPLLRAWLAQLKQQAVALHSRHRWTGFRNAQLCFDTPQGEVLIRPAVTILALGGGSWSRLGSDGAWLPLLSAAGVNCRPFGPSNCGFDYAWSEHLLARFAGAPVKAVSLRCETPDGVFERRGEAMISRHGVQGALLYHASRNLLREIDRVGQVTVYWDLLPDTSLDKVVSALAMPRGKVSMANHLRKRLGISGVKAALLNELAPQRGLASVSELATVIKNLPQTFTQPRPIDEAISTDGGISLDAVDDELMLRALPGVFCAGEMLDWDAPTGGYLLNACLASGVVAGQGALDYLRRTVL